MQAVIAPPLAPLLHTDSPPARTAATAAAVTARAREVLIKMAPFVDTGQKRMSAGFKTFFQYGAGNAQFGYCQLQREGLTSNPRNGPVGSMESGKVQRVLDILRPIFLGQKSSVGSLKPVSVPADLTAEKLATNEFLAPSLRLPNETPSYYSSCKPQGNS